MTCRALMISFVLASCASPIPSAAGNDTIVSGSWTIDRSAPTAANCAAIGVSTVRVVVYDGSVAQRFDRLTAPCSAGRVDSMNAVLAAGTYDVAWEGVAANGTTVSVGPRSTINATPSGHVIVPTIDFASGPDPRGTDATVSAHWTVGGATPTSATCGALGIDHVRVAVIASTGPIEIAALTASCSVGVIDTRPTPVLAAGNVVLALQAVDAHGAVLFSGAMATTTIAHGPVHVSLYGDVPVDFGSGGFDPRGTDASLVFGWTLDHQMAAVDLCDAVGVTDAALVLFDAADAAHAHGVVVASAPCSRGTFDSSGSPILRAGSYFATLEARDASGAVRASSSWGATPITVTAGTPVVGPTSDFAFPTTLAVTLDWALAMGTGTGTCVSAGVGTMTYSLTEHASGTVVAQATMQPCADTLSFDATSAPTLGNAAGYDLSVHGVSTDMSHAWATPTMQCSNFSVASNEITFEACVVASL
jgi:hypothetical protein